MIWTSIPNFRDRNRQWNRIWPENPAAAGQNSSGTKPPLQEAAPVNLCGCALGAPVLFPGDPSAPNLMESLSPPSTTHLLGTDELGRSILGRIIYGSRVSLMIAVGVVGVGLLFGVPIGLISGYYGGKTDFIVQRFTDMMLAFPGFCWLLPGGYSGSGIENTVISIGISMIPCISGWCGGAYWLSGKRSMWKPPGPSAQKTGISSGVIFCPM